MWTLKYEANDSMYKTGMTQGHREQICGFQGERGWKRNGLGDWVSYYIWTR